MMRKWILSISTLLVIFPIMASATWQVVDPYHGARIHQALEPGTTITKAVDYPQFYASNPRYTLHTHKGLLKTNVENFAYKHGWRVMWKTSTDYRVLLSTEIAGKNLPDVLNKLLRHYPVKAYYSTKTRLIIIYEGRPSK